MAPGGRTWAQIAAGLSVAESAGPTPPSKDAQPVHVPATAAPCPNIPNKDCEAEPAEIVLVEPCVVASRDEEGLQKGGELVKKDEKPPAEAEADAKVGAVPSLEEAQTAECVSASAAPQNLVSPSSVEDACQRSDMSTAASERSSSGVASGSCILCSGSGLLCVGLLSDPCPLCEPAGEGDERPEAEALNGNTGSDGSSLGAPPSELDRAEVIVVDESSEQNASGSEDTNSANDAPPGKVTAPPGLGKAMTAPPGLGPPGIWVWPHESDAPEGCTEATEPNPKEDDKPITWPETSVDSAEVEFLGRAAQCCFQADFLKMTVKWSEPFVKGDVSLATANVQLHLEPTAPVNFLAPLARLQAVLARDQEANQIQCFRMERSKDNSSMHITCAKVSASTCWDVLKKGFCPRPACTWEHPAPTLLNVTCAGVPAVHRTPLASLVSKPVVDAASEKIQSKDCPTFQPAMEPMGMQHVQMNQFSLNFGAIMSSDESSDEN